MENVKIRKSYSFIMVPLRAKQVFLFTIILLPAFYSFAVVFFTFLINYLFFIYCMSFISLVYFKKGSFSNQGGSRKKLF